MSKIEKLQNPIARRRFLKGATALGGAAALGFPMISRAQAKTIKVGMPTILSGRVAQLGTSSRNAVMMEVEKFNASGGLGGRKIEMVVRDSKGRQIVYRDTIAALRNNSEVKQRYLAL